jgi:glycosyltransferase involved in cell wall biosynthesis
MSELRRLCLVSRIPGITGPAGFQRRLAQGLAARGIEASYDLRDLPYDAILVTGGTRQLGGLMRARERGVPVVQRLDGMNWLHRCRRTGLRHYLRAETNNLLLRVVRSRLADALIYQSAFARDWWERSAGGAPAPATVIHNGVPLDEYAPKAGEAPPADRVVMLVVEANLSGGYELGVSHAAGLASGLRRALDRPLEVVIAGKAGEAARRAWGEDRAAVRWLGVVAPKDIASLNRAAHFLFSADLLPACPNAAIEAMACGTPVVAYDTGALRELVTAEAGRLAPYGGDPWRLGPPDAGALTEAARQVIEQQAELRIGARRRAEAAFGLDRMVEAYVQAVECARGERGHGRG